MREEANMPCLKPRSELSGGSLKLVSVDPEVQLAGVPRSRELLEFLRKHDDFYPHFSNYCRTGFSPLAACYQFLFYKVSNLSRYFLPEEGGNDLLLALMDQIVAEARKHGAEVIFVALPVQADFGRGGSVASFPMHTLARYGLYGRGILSWSTHVVPCFHRVNPFLSSLAKTVSITDRRPIRRLPTPSELLLKRDI
jgi:hypothetical protein